MGSEAGPVFPDGCGQLRSQSLATLPTAIREHAPKRHSPAPSGQAACRRHPEWHRTENP